MYNIYLINKNKLFKQWRLVQENGGGGGAQTNLITLLMQQDMNECNC